MAYACICHFFFRTFAAKIEMKMKRIVLCIGLALMAMGLRAALPEVTLQDIDGKKVNVAELAKTGKPVIISFFATWCKPCMQELEAINEIYPDWQDEYGVTMYIVSTDRAQDTHKVAPLVHGNGWEYRVLLDPNGTLQRAMNVQSVPHLFVINAKGEIVYQHNAYIPGDEAALPKYLK